MAVELIFYPSGSGEGAVDQSKLKHHYFAQLSPDGEHLVPGVLQQDRHPGIGKWIDVGAVSRTFGERYFVQYTDFNTLVPGSVISADRFPAGKWKEIKPSAPAHFHRIGFAEPFFTGHRGDGYLFADNQDFIPEIIIPILEHLYPGIVIDVDHERFVDLYWFKGDFAALALDTGQMQIFDSPGFYVGFFFSGGGNPSMGTNAVGSMGFSFTTDVPIGVYSFIMGAYNADRTLILDYIVLENIMRVI